MTEYGILVPAGHTEIHRRIGWDTEAALAVILDTELDDQVVAANVCADVPGDLWLWWCPTRPVSRTNPTDWNDRAVAVWRHLDPRRWRQRPFAGPAVFIGWEPNAAGLHPDTLAWLDAALSVLYGGGGAWPPLPGRAAS